jgi:hypothetical protein
VAAKEIAKTQVETFAEVVVRCELLQLK